MDTELRAYFFNSMYLTGIHSGIQSQHCTAEMFVKYIESSHQSGILYNWARNHKTTIVLNGGYTSNSQDLVDFLGSDENPYPWSYFCESEEALNGCLTNVGVILPEKIFKTEGSAMTLAVIGFNSWEIELMERLSECKLMT